LNNSSIASSNIVRALEEPAVLERMEQLGFDSVGSSPAQFQAYVRSGAEKLGRAIRTAGIEPQ
jgi:tripartite-type tricarboxylate transporter receptor subunit TctC